MKFQKGNKFGGRKKLEEELEIYKESVKKITLEELAKSKVYGHLKTIEDRQGIKDIALPVCLKGMTDKKPDVIINNIYDANQIKAVAGRVTDNDEDTSEEGLD